MNQQQKDDDVLMTPEQVAMANEISARNEKALKEFEYQHRQVHEILDNAGIEGVELPYRVIMLLERLARLQTQNTELNIEIRRLKGRL